MAEIVEHGRTGLLFPPGDAGALADALAWAETHPRECEVMGRAAREQFDGRYTAEANIAILMEIYRGRSLFSSGTSAAEL